MSGPVQIGVIGIGFGQQVHVPAFRADGRCRVVAICAHTLERAERVGRQLGVSEVYGDTRQMLANGQIDAVSLAVPPALQPELVIAAAGAGKHVFCEKPLSVDVPEAARALAAVEQAGVAHAIDFIFPEIPAWRHARAVLEAGTLGKLRHAALSWRVETYAFAAGLKSGPTSWKLCTAQGGGTLSQFVSHTFYYLEWLLGPLARLAARLAPQGAASDARADLWLELASGCSVTVSVAADSFLGSGHRMEIYGEHGTLLLENRTADYANGFTLSVGTRDSRAFATQECEPFPQSDGRVGAAAAIARRFIDAVLTGAPAKPNLRDGLRVQHLIAAARRADATGSWQVV